MAERHRSNDEIYEDKIQALPEHLEKGASLQMIAVECQLDVDRMTPFETQRVTCRASCFGLGESKSEGEAHVGKRFWKA